MSGPAPPMTGLAPRLALWGCDRGLERQASEAGFRARPVRDLQEALRLEREETPEIWLIGDSSEHVGPCVHAGLGALRKAQASGIVATLCGNRPPGARRGCLRAGADRAFAAPSPELWGELRDLSKGWAPPDPLAVWIDLENLVSEACHGMRNAMMAAMILGSPRTPRPLTPGLTGKRGESPLRDLSARIWQETERLACIGRVRRLRFRKLPPETLVGEAVAMLRQTSSVACATAVPPASPLPKVWADRRTVVDCLSEMALELAGAQGEVEMASGEEGGRVWLEVRLKPGPRARVWLAALARSRTQPSWLASVKLSASLHGAWVRAVGSKLPERLRWNFPPTPPEGA